MDIHTLVARQREYFLKGATRSLAFRQLALQKLQAALKAQESLLIHALPEDLGISPDKANRTMLAAQSLEEIAEISGGLYHVPERFQKKK